MMERGVKVTFIESESKEIDQDADEPKVIRCACMQRGGYRS